MTTTNDYFELHPPGADGIARLVLNRPERMNTMTLAFFELLRAAVQGLHDDGRTRVLVISAQGKHFSAGMALDVFAAEGNGAPQTPAASAPQGGARPAWGGPAPAAALPPTATARGRLGFQDTVRRLMACFDVLDSARFPVLCAVQGGCIGGALDLATACDLRYCSADAFFCLQEINIGMAADVGSLQRLPKIVAPAVAREMAYTGERVPAERALAVGLVNAVLPDADALRAHAEQVARSIAAKSPLAIAGSKMALNYARDHGTAAALAQMAVLQSAIFEPADIAEAVAAWKGKRDGRFEPLDPVTPG
jgi:enoyl-CoA hydratase